MFKKNTPTATTFKLYALALAFFSSARIILFFSQLDRLNGEDGIFFTVVKSFLMGLRFDIVIIGYILFFPILVLLIFDIFRVNSKILKHSLLVFIFALFSIAITISIADIPYFNQFFSRFSVTAFEWFDSPLFVFQMIIQEPKYVFFVIPGFLLVVFVFILLKRIILKSETSSRKVLVKIPLYLFILLVMFTGIRGRLNMKSPIRVGTAYFCDNSFLNQLGLNPVYTLLRSYFDSTSSKNIAVDLMDSEAATKAVRSYMNIESDQLKSVVERIVNPDTITSEKSNIVIVIMEGMSAAKMERGGNKNNLTPFLDSLTHEGIYFENNYSSGKHTYNGIFSTLFSFPTLYRQHTMKQMRRYNGISGTLKKHDYNTIYFTTHDGQFDNVEGFLIDNDFDRVISQKNYPSKEVKTTLGVPDDYLFRFAMPLLDELASDESPFLSVFMTSSDHGPYYIPEYFTPKSDDIEQGITEYADWSLRQFISQASTKPWFDNTVFVFISDHGVPLRAVYDISLDYHHTPLLYYSPNIIKSDTVVSALASQIDTYPTLMGLLNLPYVNNTLGIDLLTQSRPFTIINDDDKIGVLNNEFLLIMKPGEDSKLYSYREYDKKNYAADSTSLVTEMEKYAKSHLQVTQDMILNKTIFVE